MDRYTFLKRVHQLVEPAVYLEVGVQTGASMACAGPDTYCIGVDPQPSLRELKSRKLPQNGHIEEMTSDDYFSSPDAVENIDLAFIDGMHLAEYALRDFYNCEARSSASGVILLDDVLPYNRAIATRDQPPGDWTGDVWKVYPFLRKYRRDLNLRLVNVTPTGLLMVTGLNPNHKETQKERHFKNQAFWLDQEVPDDMLNRINAQDPDYVLNSLAQEMGLR